MLSKLIACNQYLCIIIARIFFPRYKKNKKKKSISEYKCFKYVCNKTMKETGFANSANTIQEFRNWIGPRLFTTKYPVSSLMHHPIQFTWELILHTTKELMARLFKDWHSYLCTIKRYKSSSETDLFMSRLQFNF